MYLICAMSCAESNVDKTLDLTQSLLESNPDSAYKVISSIEISKLKDKKGLARYALLKSIVLDKNYIDTTTFDVLEPAIEYYQNKENSIEKLKTFYYQGRIFQNRKDDENAMKSFMIVLDISNECTDTLTLARTLVAQANIFYDLYDLENYTKNFERAAQLYKSIDYNSLEFECLLHALNGAILIENKNKADSIFNICSNFKNLDSNQISKLQDYKITLTTSFGTPSQIENLLEEINLNTITTPNGLLNLATGYEKLGENKSAKELLDYLKASGIEYDTLKFMATSVFVLKGLGNYKEAFDTFWDFRCKADSVNISKFNQESRLMKERHLIELKAEKDNLKKSQIIFGCIAGIVTLVLGICILLLYMHGNKVKKTLIQQQIKIKEMENTQLKYENKILDNQLQILKNERDNLNNLIISQKELPEEVKRTLQFRVEMLNSILARYISNNARHTITFDHWIDGIKTNIPEFMDSNRLAFSASHPQFIRYLEGKGLTNEEINYVCLYAIGLRGVEVGQYIKRPGHINLSSAIRKKLGIDRHETNLGIYIRKLLNNSK